jgi:hypothetical protein
MDFRWIAGDSERAGGQFRNYLPVTATMIARIKRIASASEALIQMGDNTHHQLQLITLHSFSPMNRIVRAPVKLSPPEDVEEVLDDIVWFVSMNGL